MEQPNQNKKFGYQFNQIWESQKNISHSNDEASHRSQRNPNINTNSSKVERSTDTFRNQILSKPSSIELIKDGEQVRAVDVLN